VSLGASSIVEIIYHNRSIFRFLFMALTNRALPCLSSGFVAVGFLGITATFSVYLVWGESSLNKGEEELRWN